MEPLTEVEMEIEELYGDGPPVQDPPNPSEAVQEVKPAEQNTVKPNTDVHMNTDVEQLPGLGHTSTTLEAEVPRIAEPMSNPGSTDGPHANGLTDVQAVDPTAEENGAPEWEEDSSPYESSSEDSSDSSSDSDSDEDDYELLDPAEQARRLMEDDAGSDDEGGSKGAKSQGHRTHNEQVEEQVVKPDIAVTPEMPIEELGDVESVIENIALIKAKTSGEYQVLEAQSLLCLQDRRVIGVVSETLGRVQQPLYCVRFTSGSSMEEDGVKIGTTIFYVPQHSTFVFTKALQAVKGSDASNIYDEEIGAEEMEFSDDEAEAEWKRSLKQRKQAKRGNNTKDKGEPSSKNRNTAQATPAMNYDDDAQVDDLYTPLARPANFHQLTGSQSVEIPGRAYDRGHRGGRGRGDRGRGRGRGGRGNFASSGPRQHNLPQNPYHAQPEQSAQLPTGMPQGAFPAAQAPQFLFNSSPANHGGQQYGFQAQPPTFGQGNGMPNWNQGYQPNYQQGQPLPQQQQQQPPHMLAYQQYQQQYQQQQAQGSQPVPQYPPGAAINPMFYQNQPPQQGPQ